MDVDEADGGQQAKLRYELTTLDKVDEAYQRLREGKVSGRLVIDMSK